ncbi:MAG: hypothetical protein J6A45_02865 [Lachnospiraceae bacterium]|nr:hypothetical protein [Lachnospiraceae bacterium]
MPKDFKTKQKRLPLWPALMILSVILILFISNPVCRYFYTKDFVVKSDAQLAEMLAHDLETAGITDPKKPIFFIGSGTTRTNGSCLDLSTGKYNIYSIFAVGEALDLDAVESSQYIVKHLNKLEYDYTAPTAADWATYEAEINAVLPLEKAFPWYRSMTETEHCIVVQLSRTE